MTRLWWDSVSKAMASESSNITPSLRLGALHELRAEGQPCREEERAGAERTVSAREGAEG